MLVTKRQHGISLIEIVIALAIMGLLLAMAYPSYTSWLTNLKIRTAAEKMLDALQLTRNEAMSRNTTVRFSLVNNLTATCALSNTGAIAVISRASPATKCNVGVSESTDPFISHIVNLAEGSSGATVAATNGSAATRTNVSFNGLGRVITTSNWISQIDFSATNGGANRALRILISAGGQIRMCDPAVTSTTDTRRC